MLFTRVLLQKSLYILRKSIIIKIKIAIFTKFSVTLFCIQRYQAFLHVCNISIRSRKAFVKIKNVVSRLPIPAIEMKKMATSNNHNADKTRLNAYKRSQLSPTQREDQ